MVNEINLRLNNKRFFVSFSLIAIIVFWIASLYNFLIIRQVIGFLYITFISGFLFMGIFNIHFNSLFETLIFSGSSSIVLNMSLGLIMNILGSIINLESPLSFNHILIFFSLVYILLNVLFLKSDYKLDFLLINKIYEYLKYFLYTIPLLLVLSGSLLYSEYDNTIFFLAIVYITILFMASIILKKIILEDHYSYILFIISLSLLYHNSLISNYLLSFGSDNPIEFYFFKLTLKDMAWNPNIYDRLNSMLSITILPTIYAELIDVAPESVFKVIYPIIFSFCPVIIYKIWTNRFNSYMSYISTFLLISQNTYYTELLGLNRQIIAEVFLVSLLFVVFNKNIIYENKRILYFIFSFGLISSHYAIAEIFFIFIFIIFIYSFLINYTNKNISLTMVLIFFVLMFSWYIYTSNSSTFDNLKFFIQYVFDQFGDFFKLESRGDTVLRGLGLEAAPTIWNTLSRITAYITQFLILIGFLSLFSKKSNHHFDSKEFTGFMSLGMFFLGALIAVPGLANTLNMTRFYHILLYLIAPFFTVGINFSLKLLGFLYKYEDKIKSVMLIIILVPYLLFQIGFVYELTGTKSWSLPLSKHNMENPFLHIVGFYFEDEVFSSIWIGNHLTRQDARIYLDRNSYYGVITAYGMIAGTNYTPTLISNITRLQTNDYLYFDHVNQIDGKIFSYHVWNTTSIIDNLEPINNIYSNGGSKIFIK